MPALSSISNERLYLNEQFTYIAFITKTSWYPKNNIILNYTDTSRQSFNHRCFFSLTRKQQPQALPICCYNNHKALRSVSVERIKPQLLKETN